MNQEEVRNRLSNLAAMARRGDREERGIALSSMLEDAELLSAMGGMAESSWSGIIGEWAAVRGCSRVIGEARRAVREQRRFERSTANLRVAEPNESGTLVHGRPDLEHLQTPEGWDISRGITYRIKENDDGETELILVSHGFMVVSGLLRDVDGSDVHWHLDWQLRNHRGSAVVGRGTAQQARELAGLAKWGAPVNSGNARGLVQFLSHFEATNDGRIPSAVVSRKLGWVGNEGRYGFLWGQTLITENSEVPPNRPPSEWEGSYARLVADGGAAQLAEGYQRKGTIDGWKSVIQELEPFPMIGSMLLASLAAPLLGVIKEAPNFVIDLSGKSSHGKTSALKIAASPWGVPSSRDGGLVHSWDATGVGGERAAEMTCHLPLILDDTKRAKKKEAVAEMLYRVANGRGRLRGRPDGLREVSRWRTILLSSGEVPASSFTKDQGARARVLGLQGLPFKSGVRGELVSAVMRDISENYGHAGPMLVQWLQQNRDQWDELRDLYRQSVRNYSWCEDPALSAFRSRNAPYIALLQTAAHIAIDKLGIPIDWPAIEQLLLGSADESAKDSDVSAHAAEYLYEWAVSNTTRLANGGDTQDNSPHQGWAGRWDKGGYGLNTWKKISFITSIAKKIIEDGGYDFEAVRADWSHRGWLETSSGKTSKTIRVNGEVVRCLVVLREGLTNTPGEERLHEKSKDATG